MILNTIYLFFYLYLWYTNKLEKRVNAMNFDALIMNVIKGAAPCILGLDVGANELPGEFLSGKADAAEAVREYNRAVIDAVCGIVPAIAVNTAALLPYGQKIIADAISYAREKGMYTIADAKCSGDPIASKAEAEFYFDILGADCVTVSPYYGSAGLIPFFEKCGTDNKNVFVISHTAEGTPQDLQELVAGIRTVYRVVCEKVHIWGEKHLGGMGYSNIGIVLGGLPNSVLREFRRTYKKTVFILTGYDGKKTTAHDLNGAFDMRGLGGLVYVTRPITLPEGDGVFSERVRNAAEDIARDLKLCF